MRFGDNANRWLSAMDYLLGTAKARMLLQSVGEKTRIHYSVKYWCPSRIAVGKCCEIRHGTFLDARSSKETTIKIGDHVRIKDYVGLAAYGGEIELEEGVLVGRCTTIFGHGGVHIGSSTMLGPGCVVVSTDHLAYRDSRSFQDQGFTRRQIYIGRNVWVGANVSILSGSRIDPNTVIAAGAVVSGSLEGNWLYGGVPAKPIKPLDELKPSDVAIYSRDWNLLD
jgi:acetyltransferase-like isoleucine patch superfamily enzyme